MKIRLLSPKNVEIRKRIRESCPGFFFFFWEKCAGIPMDILPDYTDLFSKKNFDAICKFVKKTYVPFSLADCRHFYGRNYEGYCEEWRRQTRQTVEHWLSDDREIMVSRSSIQRAIDMLYAGRVSAGKDYMFRGVGLSCEREQDVLLCTESTGFFIKCLQGGMRGRVGISVGASNYTYIF